MATNATKSKKPAAEKARRICKTVEQALDELAAIDSELVRIVTEPVGTPINLTREQAVAVVDALIGTGPDHPTGVEYVREVKRRVWGAGRSRGRRPV
jgi:hypothetical protein